MSFPWATIEDALLHLKSLNETDQQKLLIKIIFGLESRLKSIEEDLEILSGPSGKQKKR